MNKVEIYLKPRYSTVDFRLGFRGDVRGRGRFSRARPFRAGYTESSLYSFHRRNRRHRPGPDGTRHKEEVINKSQIYITTAGWKNSFAYDKLIELLIQSPSGNYKIH